MTTEQSDSAPMGLYSSSKSRRRSSDDDTLRPIRISRTIPLHIVIGAFFTIVTLCFGFAWKIDQRVSSAVTVMNEKIGQTVSELRIQNATLVAQKNTNDELARLIHSMQTRLDTVGRDTALVSQKVQLNELRFNRFEDHLRQHGK